MVKKAVKKAAPKKKSAKDSRFQVNGKAGVGKTLNMSGLAKLDEMLREIGVDVKVSMKKSKKK